MTSWDTLIHECARKQRGEFFKRGMLHGIVESKSAVPSTQVVETTVSVSLATCSSEVVGIMAQMVRNALLIECIHKHLLHVTLYDDWLTGEKHNANGCLTFTLRARIRAKASGGGVGALTGSGHSDRDLLTETPDEQQGIFEMDDL